MGNFNTTLSGTNRKIRLKKNKDRKTKPKEIQESRNQWNKWIYDRENQQSQKFTLLEDS